ncbi:MAG TPA: hypothetical protein VEK15_04560 [Vicinamibacteria bacterium]|nr:hypothetical protein [Vicinamibacteria bacterium]
MRSRLCAFVANPLCCGRPARGFCDRVLQDVESPYVLIIAEIHRGDLSEIFGKLLLLVESYKRGERWATTPGKSKARIISAVGDGSVAFPGAMIRDRMSASLCVAVLAMVKGCHESPSRGQWREPDRSRPNRQVDGKWRQAPRESYDLLSREQRRPSWWPHQLGGGLAVVTERKIVPGIRA